MAEQSQRAVDGSCGLPPLDGGLALTDLPHGGQPPGLVFADTAGGDVDQWSLPTELGLQQVELTPIRFDCALARLAGQVALGRLRQCDAVGLRFLGLDLQQRLGQLGLGVVLGPLGLVPADLLPVDLGREAPGLALGALARDLSQPLVDPRHCLFPPSLDVHCWPRPLRGLPPIMQESWRASRASCWRGRPPLREGGPGTRRPARGGLFRRPFYLRAHDASRDICTDVALGPGKDATA
jgi:hypothetical protein